MAGPIESMKALWKDPKKRPWLIGGLGVAGGAGVLAMRRQGEAPAEGEEDAAAAVEGDPTSLEAAAAGDPYAAGTLPALVYVGGDGQNDPAFDEMDLSGVFAEIDGLREETIGEIDQSVRDATSGLHTKIRKQTRQNRRQQKEIDRLQKARKRQQVQRKKRVQRRKRAQRAQRTGPPKRRPPRKKPARKRVRR